jgi:hypothetical protein
MGYKGNDPCLEKVGPDEPIFVLRAQDLLAPQRVRYWAELAIERGVSQAKVDEALACADAMDAWPTRKYPD